MRKDKKEEKKKIRRDKHYLLINEGNYDLKNQIAHA